MKKTESVDTVRESKLSFNKEKKHLKNKIIIITMIVVFILLYVIINNVNKTNKVPEENTQKEVASDLINQGAVSYRVEQKKIVECSTDEIYLLIIFQSEENIQSIKYLGKDKEEQANPFEIYGNDSKKIGIDYKVEATQNYYFDVTTEAGNTEEIKINEIVKYVLSYDLNGVTGNIDSEIYTKGQKLNVTSETLTREYFEFNGWNTKPDGTGENYSSGSEIELKSNTTLYAHWVPWSHTISYNANGGTGAPENQTKIAGQQLYLSSTKPTRVGYKFVKWTTEANGNGDSYLAGSEYTIEKKDEIVTLYAQWESTVRLQTRYYAYPTRINIYNVEWRKRLYLF